MKITIEGDRDEIFYVLNGLFVRETVHYTEKLIESVEKPTQKVKLIINREEKPILKTITNIEKRGRKRKATIEQIRQIKHTAHDHPKWGDKKIARQMGMTRTQVRYWRIHTPKEINDVK